LKVLVTGGAGFIGSHICKELVSLGIDTVILDDLTRGRESNVPEGARLIRGSVTDVDAVTGAMIGVDVVFHFAARVSTRESNVSFHEDALTNIMGTLNVLACGRDAGVNRIVYSSSAAVYRDDPSAGAVSESSPTGPKAPYGISKLAGEMYVARMCATFDIDYVILRHFNVYGPGQLPGPYAGVISIFVECLLAGKNPVIFGDGGQVRDLICVEDIVQANIRAMETRLPNTTVNIGTGVPHSVNALARIILDVMGSDLEPEYKEPVEADIRYSLADTRKARELLVFQAKGALEDKIEGVVEWMKSKG